MNDGSIPMHEMAEMRKAMNAITAEEARQASEESLSDDAVAKLTEIYDEIRRAVEKNARSITVPWLSQSHLNNRIRCVLEADGYKLKDFLADQRDPRETSRTVVAW